jgi:MFS superfamily sulfate permease-like transporter
VASLVVALVALPFALGVALASGVPPITALLSAVVGGIVVGGLSGSPLQVTGPAAGLIILVFQLVQGWGLAGLGLAVLVSGVLQLAAGAVGMGRWFRAVSPALIHGLLAGVGGLIVLGQLQVLLGGVPTGHGLEDLLGLGHNAHHLAERGTQAAVLLGVCTIALAFAWDGARPKSLSAVPGVLVATAFGIAATYLIGLPVATVEVPTVTVALTLPTTATLGLLFDGSFIALTLALTFVATVESLLTAAATDRLHDGPRTAYDQELRALGLGNVICGLLGLLPVTGVIVRSAANVAAGSRTRLSAVLHGVWILGLLVLAPFLLGWLPIPVLAGLLITVGLQLMKPAAVKKLAAVGRWEVAVFIVTAVGIVMTDLLIGMALGFGLALLRIVYAFTRIEIDVVHRGERVDVNLRGAATFLGLPRIADALEALPEDKEVHLHIGGLLYVDHACHTLLREQETRLERGGGMLVTEWDDLWALRSPRTSTANPAPTPTVDLAGA